MDGIGSRLSILSAPALCDRRALSQAWYSALHLPEHHAVARVRANAQTAAQSKSRPNVEIARASLAHRAAHEAAAHADRRAIARNEAPERRAPRSRLAARIERAWRKASVRPSGTAFSLEGETGRVAIFVRTRAGRIELVALCKPHAREAVARALEQARYRLALRGARFDAQVRSFAS